MDRLRRQHLRRLSRGVPAVTTPVRLQLRRTKGFRLQEHSEAVNGLPARRVTRPGLFGNIFKVTGTNPASDAVKSFRRFLRTWSDAQIMRSARDEDGNSHPAGGVALIVHRNHIRACLWQLRGHNLACFCGLDQPCHADVLIDILVTTDLPKRWKAKYPRLCEEVAP